MRHTITTFLAVPLLVLGLVLLSACDVITGSDSGSGNPFKSSTWFGTNEDNSFTLQTIEVRFDSSGDIEAILLDGVSISGASGPVSKEQGNIFGFELDNGTAGGFIREGDYAAFVTDNNDIGAVQKDASALGSPYQLSDVTGSFDGTTVIVDAFYELLEVLGSQVTVSGDGSFSGEDDDGTTFTGSISVDDSTYGRYTGSFSNSLGESGSVTAIATPDKQFIGSYACDSGGFYPEDCSFSAWQK